MKKVVGVVLVLLVVVAAAVYLGFDSIVKRVIEEGTGYATGVPTKVRRVDVGLFSGQVKIGALEVANPPGYETPYFFQLSELKLAVQPQSLLEPVVYIPEFVVNGAHINLERSGTGSNVNTILQNLTRLSGKTGRRGEPAPAGEEAGPDTRFVIQKLKISGVSARARLAPELGRSGTVEASIPPITLEKVGTDTGGVTLPQLAALITEELIAAATREMELPADLDRAVKQQLQRLESLEGAASEEVEKRAPEELERGKKALRRLLEPR